MDRLERERRYSLGRLLLAVALKAGRFVRSFDSTFVSAMLTLVRSILHAERSGLLVEVGRRSRATAATAVRGSEGLSTEYHLLRRD